MLVNLLTDKRRKVFGGQPKDHRPKRKDEPRQIDPLTKKLVPPLQKTQTDMTVNIIIVGSEISRVTRASRRKRHWN